MTAEVAARLGGHVIPTDSVGNTRASRGLDLSDMTLRGPCPSCGQPTPCGWRERDRLSGRWRDVRSDPTPCTDCRTARAAAGESVWEVRPRPSWIDGAARLEGGVPASWWLANAGQWAAAPVPQDSPVPASAHAQDGAAGSAAGSSDPPGPAAVSGPHRAAPPSPTPSKRNGAAEPAAERPPATRGTAVEVRAGVLYVNGAAVASGVDPAAVTVLGRRVCVGGRQVAELAA